MQSTESTLHGEGNKHIKVMHTLAEDESAAIVDKNAKQPSDSVFEDTCTPTKRFKVSQPVTSMGSSNTKTVVDPSSSLVTPMPTMHPSAPQQSSNHHPTPLSKQEIKNLLLQEANYCGDTQGQKKRADYISWDDYFMAVAALSAHRSKDPGHPAGACIVDARNRIIGIGYAGFPAGCSDDCLPWTNTTSKSTTAQVPWLHSPQPYTVHAEINAVLNKCSESVAGAVLYTDHFPCNECAKVLVQSRISSIVYRIDSQPDSDSSRASRILFRMAGISLRQYQPSQRSLQLDFTPTLDAGDCCNGGGGSGSDDAHAIDATAVAQAKRDSATAVEQYRDLLIQEAGYDPVERGSTKREGYISWDDYFMAVSFLTAQGSKDPNTQVGACIVDTDKRIIGLGYNGFPAGCHDDMLPWSREGESALHKKYLYVCHAEVNAILNKCSADVKGACLYVALFPCNDCAKMIIQAGIVEVVYMSDRYHDSDACRASRIMFQMAGVKLRKHIPTMDSVSIQLDDASSPLTNDNGNNE